MVKLNFIEPFLIKYGHHLKGALKIDAGVYSVVDENLMDSDAA